MSSDEKYGIGAGLLALGLAACVILLGQLTFNKKAEDAMAQASTAAANASLDSGKGPADSSKGPAAEPAAMPSLFYRVIPHREPVLAEEIFDGIVCALALPAGIFFFASAIASNSAERDTEEVEDKKTAKKS